ncbi:pantoate--beta-alanine ligase [Lachnospiraceae bacterium NSJ-143]|nr:pantoate--beta-alanine ligase [Lachnospiraceae bacterium NSJ-143]
MKVINTIEETRSIISRWRSEGLSVGLVPTMGFLHDGHKSLISRAVKENDRVVVSIFVNPIQFGKNEDLSVYPKDMEKDFELCKSAGADFIFNPESEEMYYSDFSTFVDAGDVAKELCGKSRPVHFRGVCTVVTKLLNIVKPDRVYFGQKDAQQLAIVKRMVRDLSVDVEVIGCPIIREEDGLAKSSRNVYLSPDERKAAVILNKALSRGKELVDGGEKRSSKIIRAVSDIISTEKLARIDYVDVVSFPQIQHIETINCQALVAVAVYIGKTRLIDNFITE